MTGVQFYNEVGFLAFGLKNGDYTSSVKATAKKLQYPVENLDHMEIKKRFPYLGIMNIHEGVYTNKNSGHISPRNLVTAQKMAARKGGCDIINDVVTKVTPIGPGGYQIEAERSGQVIKGKKILLATGCFTESRDLLPRNLKPLVNPMSITVLLVSDHPLPVTELY